MKKLNKILILLLAIFMLFSNVGLNMVYAEDDNEKEPPIEEVIPPIDEEPDTPTAEEILNVEKAIAKQALSDYTASIKDVEASELTKVKNTALSNIDKAKSVDEVNQALEAGKTALKNIDKIKPPEVDKPKPPKDDAKDEEVVETPLSSNNYLSSLTLSEGSLNFSRQVLSYRVVVDNNVSSLRVSATADDKGATVSGTGIKYLDVYANEIIITVKAENGSERVYTINVIRLDEDGNEEEVDSSNELLSLTISGCDLDFDADILDYKCEVDNLVDKVKIDALAVDEDAVVEISNIDKLIVGDNLIKIKVTAINGDIKTYTVTVNRSNTVGIIMIEDLSKALETLEADEITVIANSSEIVSKALMQKIKDSKKIVYINKLDSSDELLYSWRIDGSKITYVDTLYTKISLDRNKNSNLDTHIKDYKGLVLAFNDNPSLPLNTKVGINVNNQFKNRAKLNLYYYDKVKDDISLEEADLRVKDDMVWINLSHTSEYFLTSENLKGEKNSISISFVISLLIFVLLLAIGFREYLKRNRRNKLKLDYLNIDEVDLNLSEEDYSKVSWGKKRPNKR